MPVSNLGSFAGEGGLSAGEADLFNTNYKLTLHFRGHEHLRAAAVAVAGLITDLLYTVALFTAPGALLCSNWLYTAKWPKSIKAFGFGYTMTEDPSVAAVGERWLCEGHLPCDSG